ncbi:MAG: FlgD immunoglobulin-like domain containing protein, partial [Bacteroidota bacterium]
EIEKLLQSGKYSHDILQTVKFGDSGFTGKWYEKGSNNLAGRIHTADIDWTNNLIYAASSGGNIWRGTINGTDWTCLNNTMQISNIRGVRVLNIMGIKRIIVFGNGSAAVYFSDNEGATWTKAKGLEKPAGWGSIYRGVVTARNNTIYVLCSEWDYKKNKSVSTIYKSADFGENFEFVKKLELSLSYCDIWAPKYDKDDVYLIHRDTVSKTNIEGIFQQISTYKITQNLNQIGQILLQGSVVNNTTTLVALFRDNSGTGAFVYSSVNEGKDWIYGGYPPTRTFEQNSFFVSTLDPKIMFTGNTELYRSFDGGQNWTKVNNWAAYYGDPVNLLHADIPGIMGFRDKTGKEIYLIGTDGGLYISKDNIQKVENLSLYGLNVSQYYGTYTFKNKPGILFVGSQDQGFQRSLSDDGEALNLEQTISGDYGQLCSSDSGNYLWSVYPGFIMLYVGADKISFQDYSLNFDDMKNWLWMPPLTPNPLDPKSVYLVSGCLKADAKKSSHIWNVQYQSGKIKKTPLPYNFAQKDSNTNVSSFAFSPVTPDIAYATTTSGTFFMSTDGGSSWIESKGFNGPDAHYFYGNHIVPSQKEFGKVYIGGSGYSNSAVYMTPDHGKTFLALDSNLPKCLVYRLAVSADDEFLFAATDAGPYVYVTKDKRWYDLASLGAPDQTYWSVEYLESTKTARFCTYGRGVWDFKIGEEIPSDVKETKVTKNTQINISAYPNPFSQSTKIEIQSENREDVSLKIYDIEGRLIRNLYNDELQPGTNTFLWQGETADGVRLPAGMYMLLVTCQNKINYVILNLN